jgi:hypothetical protein
LPEQNQTRKKKCFETNGTRTQGQTERRKSKRKERKKEKGKRKYISSDLFSSTISKKKLQSIRE